MVSFLLFLLSSSNFPLQNSHEGKQAQLKKVAPSLLLPSLTGSRGELQRRDARRESSRAGGGGGGSSIAGRGDDEKSRKWACNTFQLILHCWHWEIGLHSEKYMLWIWHSEWANVSQIDPKQMEGKDWNLKLYENVYPAPCRSNDYAVHQEQAPHISARPPHTTPPAAQVLKTRS